jgi:hypothetical protein
LGSFFDPDTGNTYGLDPIGVFLWKRLDGKHFVEDILSAGGFRQGIAGISSGAVCQIVGEESLPANELRDK